jgi:hypothetical protein
LVRRQEFLGYMLGVHRPSASVAAGTLREEGLIHYRRGRIHVRDRAGLEYLENAFYQNGLAATGLIAPMDLPVFQQVGKHETDHVALLQGVLGSSAVAEPTFDFSGGSGSGTDPFGNPFTNYTTFKALSQAFEDTGVRAYKGQATVIQAAGPTASAYLTVAAPRSSTGGAGTGDSTKQLPHGNTSPTTP